ncbi:MAG: DegV family protein [Coriobacteriales bacterium]|jgi:DegV family protein with EDD domain|nr:DegV family protein [Coriobacteriales bacterium]
MRIKVIADSTCDLSPELLAMHDIRRMPLTIVMGEAEYKDGDEVSPQDIFQYVASGQGISHTAAVNVEEYRAAYQADIAAGAEGIVHFTISSELSSCYENALKAAEGLENIHVVDTRSLSTGGGWLVLYAIDLIKQGLGVTEVAQRCEAKKHLSDTSFVINTLEYLHKGGRCSGLTALSANLLSIKPCLELKDGRIEVGRKYHGAGAKVVRQYLHDRLEGREDLDLRRAFVTHTYFDEPDFVAEMIELVKQLQPFEEVLETSAGCTVSNHCGPGTLGVLVYRKDA